jgi:hypothetical protein
MDVTFRLQSPEFFYIIVNPNAILEFMGLFAFPYDLDMLEGEEQLQLKGEHATIYLNFSEWKLILEFQQPGIESSMMDFAGRPAEIRQLETVLRSIVKTRELPVEYMSLHEGISIPIALNKPFRNLPTEVTDPTSKNNTRDPTVGGRQRCRQRSRQRSRKSQQSPSVQTSYSRRC